MAIVRLLESPKKKCSGPRATAVRVGMSKSGRPRLTSAAALTEAQRWRVYRAIPQKDWRLMSGRQAKVLQEQAALYGIPFAEATIDLPSVVRALHDFFAHHHAKFANPPPSEREAPGSAEESPALERKRLAEAQLKELELARTRGELIPRPEVHQLFERLAALLRRAGEQLGRQAGPTAQQVLADALTDLEREITSGPLAATEDGP